MSAVSYKIDRQAHQRRCRAALELLASAGPQLPEFGDRPRVITGIRGETRLLTARGFYVSID